MKEFDQSYSRAFFICQKNLGIVIALLQLIKGKKKLWIMGI